MKSIKSYQDAKAYLGNKKERPYANNTRIEIDPLNLGHEVITVKYHGNGVVNLFPDGTMTFNSCGWRTLTTKERINWFLPDGFRLYQEHSTWYISKHMDKSYLFADGIAIKNGIVYNAGPEDEQDTIKDRIKAIKNYVNGFVTALLNGEVGRPSVGDCWYCCMVTDKGETLGDATNNTEHLESHMEESYFVPSLLVHAIEYRDACMLTKSTIQQIWNGESVSEWQKDITARDVKASLTAYLKHEFNIAQ